MVLSGDGLHGTPPSHGHGGGSGDGLPYTTAADVSQLIADINYADKAGGTVTINLKPNTTFDLTTYNNANGNGVNGLPVIGGTKAVNLTILGNGDTIERDVASSSDFRLLEVAQGASLTLDHVTLQNGYAADADGGAILNQGTLKVSNSTLSGNIATFNIYTHGGSGGGICNDGGEVTVSNSILSGNFASYGGGICNVYGTVKVSNSSTLSGNSADAGGGIYNSAGTVSVSGCNLTSNSASNGGGIYINGGTLTLSNSILFGNSAYDGGGIYNSAGTVSVSGCNLSGNSAKTGAYYSTSGSSVTFGGLGGGIYNVGGTLTVTNSGFQNNSPDNIDGTYSGSGNTGL